MALPPPNNTSLIVPVGNSFQSIISFLLQSDCLLIALEADAVVVVLDIVHCVLAHLLVFIVDEVQA